MLTKIDKVDDRTEQQQTILRMKVLNETSRLNVDFHSPSVALDIQDIVVPSKISFGVTNVNNQSSNNNRSTDISTSNSEKNIDYGTIISPSENTADLRENCQPTCSKIVRTTSITSTIKSFIMHVVSSSCDTTETGDVRISKVDQKSESDLHEDGYHVKNDNQAKKHDENIKTLMGQGDFDVEGKSIKKDIDDDSACFEHTITASTTASKSIGQIGSISIAVNSLAGPAILQLPFQYQRSGLIPTTMCLIGVAVLSGFCCLHMANTVSKIEGNRNYDKCVEFSDPFRYFWNNFAYKLTQVLFFLTAICMNIASIVDTAEVVDSALGIQMSSSYGISFLHDYLDNSTNIHQHSIATIQRWSHHDEQTGRRSCSRIEVKQGYCDPFNDTELYGNILLTAGYLITAAVFVPICLKDLKENTSWQIFGFSVLMTLSCYFCYCFGSVIRLKDIVDMKRLSLWGYEWGDMLGVIMFNFALVLAIPAWLHEKRRDVSVRAVVIQSTFLSTVLYVAVGVLGALALPRVNENMLSPMVSGAYGKGLQVAGSIFAFFIIGLDIPLFSVLTRYNLTHSGLCSVTTANWLVVYIPWGLSWLLYQGDSVAELLSWGGIIFTSAIAFILPLYLSLRATRMTNVSFGSVDVYGDGSTFRMTRRYQIKILRWLLLVSIGSVAIAIIGKMLSTSSKKEYLNSSSYVNDTEVLLKTTATQLTMEVRRSYHDIQSSFHNNLLSFHPTITIRENSNY